MKRTFSILFLVFFLALSSSPTIAKEPDRVFKKGDWELQISYSAKGTKSEGQYGVLFYKDEKIKGTKKGETRSTDLGELKYYGSPDQREQLWHNTGWNFSDTSKIMHSTQLEEAN